jgi:galactose mutarotase-like enzyme
MSDWYQIESNSLIVQVTSLGAEMKRLFSKEWNRELLWLGTDKLWERSAPVLFPIVGRLKDDEYNLKGKNYKMTRHGFARDMEFKGLECGVSEVEFLLGATQETFASYPFCFELRVRYKLEEKTLTISYFVKNEDRQDIYFSIGAHPAFETKDIQNYEVHFENTEKAYYKTKDGLMNWTKEHPMDADKLKPDADLFKDDALVFKKLKSNYIDLVDLKRSEAIRVKANSPYWALWSTGKVPFVCIEPWFGVADSTTHDKNFETKEGIVTLAPGEIFGFSYSIETSFYQPPVEVKKK